MRRAQQARELKDIEDEQELDLSSTEEQETVEEEESDDDENEEESNELKSQLNKMSFEEIMKFQNKLGLKKYKEALKKSNEKAKVNNFKRLNKNRPQEVTSKKPVSAYRQIFATKKREIVDPRFSSAFGEYKPESFRKAFDFINDLRENEKHVLTEELKKERDGEKRQEIKSALMRLQQQLKSQKDNEKRDKLKEKIKEETIKDARAGKRPHFINKTERNLLEMAEKYKNLKSSGKIDNYLAKQRKKQLSKDFRQINKNQKSF